MIGPRAFSPLILALSVLGCEKREPVAPTPVSAPGTVQGTIVDEQGKGVPGVDVAPSWDLYSLSPIGGTKTDGNGNYTLRAPTVSWDPDRTEIYAIDADRTRGAVITIFKDTRSPRTTLRPLVTARVRLETKYADPIPEQTLLRIEKQDGGEIFRSIWRGPQFDLRVPPGTYRLQVEGDGIEGYEAMVLDAAKPVVDYPVVTLKPTGGWRTDPVSVTGSVVDLGGRPVSGAELSPSWQLDPMLPRQPWTTDAKGDFTLDLGFEPGRASKARRSCAWTRIASSEAFSSRPPR